MVPKRHPADRLEDPTPQVQDYWAVYLFGTVCPERDAAFGLVLPVVGADVMQTFLDQLGGEVSPGAHALLVMGRAGWHCANALVDSL